MDGSSLSLGNLAAGGAIGGLLLGTLTAGWTKIKAIAWRFASLLILRVELEANYLDTPVVSYLANHLKRSRFYDRRYEMNYEHSRDGKYGMVPYEKLLGRSILFWNGWWPILYGASLTKDNSGNIASNSQTLTCLRGTVNVEKIIKDACNEANERAWNNGKNVVSRRFFVRNLPLPRDDNQNGQAKQETPKAANYQLQWYQHGSNVLLSHKPDDLGLFHPGPQKAMNYLIFPERVMKLIEEIRIWRSNREWYQKRGIPWKRGWLLYGPPGTGKTALARAFAEDEDMPLFVFSLGEMSNSEFLKAWTDLQAHVPCIALFEDFDNVFHGRRNIARGSFMMEMLSEYRGGNGGGNVAPASTPQATTGSGSDGPQGTNSGSNNNNNQPHDPGRGGGFGITFDCLLNCLDGARKAEGVFTIITTNDLSKLDPALGQPRQLESGEMEFISTRPGRIDKAIELGYMEHEDKIEMSKRILTEFPERLEDMFEWLESHRDLQETPAQFQERCAQIALNEFWKEQKRKQEEAQLQFLEVVDDSTLDSTLEEAA